MSTSYVHTLGDSTIDNVYWMIGLTRTVDEAKECSVEGQLSNSLKGESSAYEVISHAYDGFTTSSVLDGDIVGRVLAACFTNNGFRVPYDSAAYLRAKNIDVSIPRPYTVYPLQQFKKSVEEHPDAPHYVVISVAGNDFREQLLNPLMLLSQIPFVHRRYLQIVKEVQSLEGRTIRPILMFQYQLDRRHDHYYIYAILKVVGVIFAGLHLLSLLGIGASAVALVGKKLHHRLGPVSLVISAALLALSHSIIPLKVTKNILMKKHEIGLATLGGLMETFYSPILAYAKAHKIPILDLPNTFNPKDSDLYISQIEPSAKGGKLIAEGLSHIIKEHDFDTSESLLYVKKEGARAFSAAPNPGSRGWSVDYPVTKTVKEVLANM